MAARMVERRRAGCDTRARSSYASIPGCLRFERDRKCCDRKSSRMAFAWVPDQSHSDSVSHWKRNRDRRSMYWFRFASTFGDLDSDQFQWRQRSSFLVAFMKLLMAACDHHFDPKQPNRKGFCLLRTEMEWFWLCERVSEGRI